MRRRQNGRRCACAAGLWLLAAAGLSIAAEGDPPLSAPPSPPPVIDLDQLLKLPDSLELGIPRRGGVACSEWRSRFAEARGDLAAARAALDAAQQELGTLAGGTNNWQMAAPGGVGAENSPVSYQLRQEIRRQRDEIESSERRLRDLEVEAELAGAPDECVVAVEDAGAQSQE